jgi:hypothetical protein
MARARSVLSILPVLGGCLGASLVGVWVGQHRPLDRDVHVAGTHSVAKVFFTVENPTGIYTYDCLDEEALCDFTCDELLGALRKALEQVPHDSDGSLHRMDASCAWHLSLALIDHCQARGVAALLDVYLQSRGEEVKGRVAEALAKRERREAVPTIVNGIRGEESPWVLELVDSSLSDLTFLPRYYSQESPSEVPALGWMGLYQYWRERTAQWGGTFSAEPTQDLPPPPTGPEAAARGPSGT